MTTLIMLGCLTLAWRIHCDQQTLLRFDTDLLRGEQDWHGELRGYLWPTAPRTKQFNGTP